jgi:membrane-bound lytic murein transglycosylase MltF
LYFLDKGGQQRGLMYDMMTEFEKELNAKYAKKNLRLHFIFIPTTRNQPIPSLVAGRGDIIAANLTVTSERETQVDFSTPIVKGVKEVIVSSAKAPALNKLDDLSGKIVFVNPTSSYYQSLKQVNADFSKEKLAPINIKEAPGIFETDDILEMVQADLVQITVSDLYLAKFWKNIFPNIQIYEDLVVRSGGDIAFAFRKKSPQLKLALDTFTDSHKIGTSFGNQKLQTYLKSVKWVKAATNPQEIEKFNTMAGIFQLYGDQYKIDWLLMTAQGYQESRLDQNVKSRVGAVGVMQLMPATGKELKVGDIHNLNNNINGGVKYVRYLIEKYYANEPMTELDKVLFAFAAYNAGPSKIQQMRLEAAKRGLDPNIWFDNVERIVAERIGSETVQYVSNIYKYSVAYKLVREMPTKTQP